MDETLNKKIGIYITLTVIVAINALVYLPPYTDSFISDDVRQLAWVSLLLDSPLQAYKMFNPFWLAWYYRPVQHLLTLVCFELFGFNPYPYYVVLLMFHIAAIILLYKLARKFKVSQFGALSAIVLFSFNSQNWQVLGWMSCFGIVCAAVFSLLAMLTFLDHLDHQKGWRTLVATIVFSLLALLSREESLVLPFLLFFMWLTHSKRENKWIEHKFLGFFAILSSLWFSYLLIQLIRTRVTNFSSGVSLQVIANSDIVRDASVFMREIFHRYTLIDIPIFQQFGLVVRLLVIGLALIIGFVWFFKSDRATRFGLIWGILYLSFLFLAIFIPTKVLDDNDRYMYLPWLGISLALGASVDALSSRINQPTYRQYIVLAVGLTILSLTHVRQISEYQNKLYLETRRTKDIEQQMRTLLPNPSSSTHLFATRFVPSEPADYVAERAYVWYRTPFLWPGGDFSRLKELGWANSDFYLFDYREGVLYNLMPELQAHQKTIFLWSHEPSVGEWDHKMMSFDSDSSFHYATDQVVGTDNDKRLSIEMQPPENNENYASLGYSLEIPENSELHFAIMKHGGGLDDEDGMAFRVRVERDSGEIETVFERFIDYSAQEATETWIEVALPMPKYWSERVNIYLEVAAGENAIHDDGYWANPRLVID